MQVEKPERPRLSYSGYRAYDECQRKWLYSQAADDLSDRDKWPAKQQKRLAPWQSFAGKIVDETVNTALRHYRANRVWPEDLYAIAKALRTKAWIYSQEWVRAVENHDTWPPSPFFQPLDRHYYREVFSSVEITQIRDCIRACIESFTRSSIVAFIGDFDIDCWRGPRSPDDHLAWFRVGQAPVWISFDFALHTPDVTYIFDWKSGKRTAWSALNAREQLLWYALYVCRVWGVEPRNVRFAAVWLGDGASFEFSGTDEDELRDLEDRIAIRYRDVVAQLERNELGLIPLENWPLTANLRLCRSCQFRGVCDGSRRLQLAEASRGDGDAEDDVVESCEED